MSAASSYADHTGLTRTVANSLDTGFLVCFHLCHTSVETFPWVRSGTGPGDLGLDDERRERWIANRRSRTLPSWPVCPSGQHLAFSMAAPRPRKRRVLQCARRPRSSVICRTLMPGRCVRPTPASLVWSSRTFETHTLPSWHQLWRTPAWPMVGPPCCAMPTSPLTSSTDTSTPFVVSESTVRSSPRPAWENMPSRPGRRRGPGGLRGP